MGQQWKNGHCTGTAKTYTWDEARELRSEGWRMPTEPELKSLVDPGRKSRRLPPVIDISLFPDLPYNRNASFKAPLSDPNNVYTSLPNFWTSTALASCISSSRLGCGAYVDFDSDSSVSGYWLTIGRETRLYVRLVRAAPPEQNRRETTGRPASTTSADSRFVINGNEAFDRQAGLTWQRCDAERHVLPDGLGCSGVERLYTMTEALQLGGNGWRLPTKDELMTLLDRKRLQQKIWPKIDTTVFLDMDEHSNIYWTSTPYDNPRSRKVYCVDFSMAWPSNCGTYPMHARLVRNGP